MSVGNFLSRKAVSLAAICAMGLVSVGAQAASTTVFDSLTGAVGVVGGDYFDGDFYSVGDNITLTGTDRLLDGYSALVYSDATVDYKIGLNIFTAQGGSLLFSSVSGLLSAAAGSESIVQLGAGSFYTLPSTFYFTLSLLDSTGTLFAGTPTTGGTPIYLGYRDAADNTGALVGTDNTGSNIPALILLASTPASGGNVPEPASFGLAALALAGLRLTSRRNKA